MPRIGNVDHVLMLLQQQLQKLDGAKKREATSKTGRIAHEQDRSSLRRISEISANRDISDEDFGRALIRAILVDELGDGLSEDHRFDTLVAQVYDTIAQDDKFSQLLEDAAAEARAGKPK